MLALAVDSHPGRFGVHSCLREGLFLLHSRGLESSEELRGARDGKGSRAGSRNVLPQIVNRNSSVAARLRIQQNQVRSTAGSAASFLV